MSRIIDMGDYCVHTKYILSVSISDDNKYKNYYLNIKFRYNNDRLSLNYDNKQERDRDYKKICNEWKNNKDKYGD